MLASGSTGQQRRRDVRSDGCRDCSRPRLRRRIRPGAPAAEPNDQGNAICAANGLYSMEGVEPRKNHAAPQARAHHSIADRRSSALESIGEQDDCSVVSPGKFTVDSAVPMRPHADVASRPQDQTRRCWPHRPPLQLGGPLEPVYGLQIGLLPLVVVDGPAVPKRVVVRGRWRLADAPGRQAAAVCRRQEAGELQDRRHAGGRGCFSVARVASSTICRVSSLRPFRGRNRMATRRSPAVTRVTSCRAELR